MEKFTTKEMPVKDIRIVRLNEIIAIKSTSLLLGERPILRAKKESARYILKNWDNSGVGGLRSYVEDEENKIYLYELWCIAKSRLDQLLNEKKAL